MRISIFCFLPFGVATAVNLRRSAGAGAGLVADAPDDAHRQTFKLEMNNHKGVQYTAPVTLDKQELMAVYDTGSFEVMAVSRQCKVCDLPGSLALYDNSTSHTFVSGHGADMKHQFAGGLVVARQDFETIHVGTAQSVFKEKNMPFWQVVDTDMLVWTNKKASFNAIVGLGHRKHLEDASKGTKPTESLIERTGTERFAICLERGPSNPGYLTFNPPYDFKSTNWASVFRRIAVIGEHHWAVKLNSVSVKWGDQVVTHCGKDDKHPCVAILDSGTSLIGVPPNAVPMVYDVVGAVKYDCGNLDSLPELIFELDGQKFVMPGSAYTVQLGGTTAAPDRCLPAFTDFDMRSNQGVVWILGMPFLRHFYTVFDRKEPSIYVAEQGDNCEPAAGKPSAPGNQGTFVNATGLKMRSQATVADISEARLPSWATGQKYMEV